MVVFRSSRLFKSCLAGCYGVTKAVVQRCSIKKASGLQLYKVAGLRPATLLKKRLWYRCFSVNFAKFLGTSFLTKHLQWCYNTNPFASPLPHDFYAAIIEEKVYQTFSFSMSGWKQLLSLYSPLKTIDSKL